MKKILLFVAAAVMVSLAPAGAMAATDANWDKMCAKCHGKEGAGDTKMGQKMGAKDYSKADVQAKFTDDQLFKAIKDGAGENMPAYGKKLTDDQIKALVAQIRAFKK
jgi:mono/diheme cytochrome c family protein